MDARGRLVCAAATGDSSRSAIPNCSSGALASEALKPRS
jgi:hypothetical protein